MKMLPFTLGLIMVIASTSSAFFPEIEDEEEECPLGVYATKEGASVYSNAGGNFFTFEIGNRKTTSLTKNKNLILNVEGKGVQVIVVPFWEFLSSEEIKKDTNELAILQKHSQFEIKHIQELLKTVLKVRSEHKKCKNGRLILVWSFSLPENPEAKENSVKQQLLMTTVVKNSVVALDGIIVNEDDYDEFYSLLENFMNTIELRKTPYKPEEPTKGEKIEKVTASKETNKPEVLKASKVSNKPKDLEKPRKSKNRKRKKKSVKKEDLGGSATTFFFPDEGVFCSPAIISIRNG